MQKTVIAAFPGSYKARKAEAELKEGGLRAESIQVVGPQTWWDVSQALDEPEENILSGRAGLRNPEMVAATAADDVLRARGAGLPGIERQWQNHPLLVIRGLEEELVPGVTMALRQLGAEHVVVQT